MSEARGARLVTHEEIADRLDQVEGRLRDGSGEFAEIKTEMAQMRSAIDEIKDGADKRMAKVEAVAADTAAIRELVELMALAKRAGRFARFMGRIFGWVFSRMLSLLKWGGLIAATITAYFVLLRELTNFLNPKG